MPNDGKKNLLISSMMRSGSTLLQRALNTHENIHVEYQTNTDSFLSYKRRYLNKIGCKDYHVFPHYNPPSSYSFSDFNSWALQENNIDSLLETSLNKKKTATVVGIKEVLVEEFYSLLLSHGVFCLNIIRDPRDVIASMSFGSGHEHTGNHRPILFDLRNWRKSVFFAEENRLDNRFKNILFEDLICNTQAVLDEIHTWLGVNLAPLKIIEERLKQLEWKGNSSFGPKQPFDHSALGKYKNVLPNDVKSYVEAVCYQEMLSLGYEVNINKQDRAEIIKNFREPFVVKRAEFLVGYSTSAENINYELARI